MTPGKRPEGFTVLHNQWRIHPAGLQLPVGDFPMNMAIDPTGRYVAILHAGYGRHEVRVVDLESRRTVSTTPIEETFYGITFSPEGRTLVCSGASSEVVHRFAFAEGTLSPLPDFRMGDADSSGVLAGIAFSPDGKAIVATFILSGEVALVDAETGRLRWHTRLDRESAKRKPMKRDSSSAPNEQSGTGELDNGAQPLAVTCDAERGRVYVSEWGHSTIAVLDANTGAVLAHWRVGLHPNEMVLSHDGRRLFVANGGENTVTVIDCASGHATANLSSALAPRDRPGSTPDSLALSPTGTRLFVANAYNDNVAVFDLTRPDSDRPVGYIPTGWFPTSVRVTPTESALVVLSARGLEPKPSANASTHQYTPITRLYEGSLGIVKLPGGSAFDQSLTQWTAEAEQARPRVGDDRRSNSPIPFASGESSPIRHVLYVIKENRTYDQVFGDMSEGNGDPKLCLFPESVTPNLHALAREFVLLDNFYANAEVSASGHEWSTGAYASEFVEKTWPIEYGHKSSKMPYTAEGRYAAAIPAGGQLWDRAAAAGISYRSYGEFVFAGAKPGLPGVTAIPALRGHFDPFYRGWDIHYRDVDRVARFIADLKEYEISGVMPQLQILRLPQDHTEAAKQGAWTPTAMVADNDLATGRLVDAVSHSRFWSDTAIFIVEDDAQSGPDHIDAHRTEALVISPWSRRHAVDSTPYTTCSMLRTIELILGLEPMSQFDATANPMTACFEPAPNFEPWPSVPAQVDMNARNPGGTAAARESEHFDFTREDAVDDGALNRVVWSTVRGEGQRMPAPVHASFVRPIRPAEADDD